jgi:FixJ family two-component response regulator
MAKEENKIVVVDDNASMRGAIKRLLNAAGFKVNTFESAEELLQTDVAREAACLVLDVHLPGLSGFELNQQLVGSGVRLPVVFITAYDEPAARNNAEKAGAVAYLIKPFPGRKLLHAINHANSAERSAFSGDDSPGMNNTVGAALEKLENPGWER